MSDLELIDRTIADLQELRRRLQARSSGRCSPADLRMLAILLPAIAGKFGSCAVTTREILQDPAIQALFPGSSGSLGSLLAKAADDAAQADGYCVQRGGKVHSAMTWGVYRLPEVVVGSQKAERYSRKKEI